MADYQLALRANKVTLVIPVLPDTLAVESPGDNETAKVIGMGEVNRLRHMGLKEVGWKSFFPAHPAPYVSVTNPLRPMEYIKVLQAWRDTEVAPQVVLAGADLGISIKMAIESLNWEERGGEPGDIYYDIQLKEWKDTRPTRIKFKKNGTVVLYKPSPDKARHTGNHVVGAGETLWAVAQRYFGDGGRYGEIYNENKKVIDAENKKTGNPKYTIYAGQVLKVTR